MSIVDIAKKISQAKAVGGGSYIPAGKGRLIVKSLKADKLFAGDTFIAEFYIDQHTPLTGGADKTGTTCTFLQQFDKRPQTAFGATKAFLLALLGQDTATEAELEDAIVKVVSTDNPCRGMVIAFETYEKPTKDNSKILTLPKWETLQQGTAQDIAARRSMLDGKDVPAPTATA